MNSNNLIPVIVQDVTNNNILMLAYTNGEALKLTKKTGFLHFYSRSRKELWKKGETSGNVMKVKELLFDCDRDTILARVIPPKISCHLNKYSCFNDKKFPSNSVFERLNSIFQMRKKKPSKKSYTTYLLNNHERLLKKVLEESGEVVLASVGKKKSEITYESADLMYHLLVLLFKHGLSIDNVQAELERRLKDKAILKKN